MSELSRTNDSVEPCIGMLDSGVGGLSVLLEVQKLLPGHSIRYIGDSAWCPYGSKPAALIQQRVFKLTDKLIEHGANIIVVACNSATINAVEALRARYPIPFVGMEPAVKPAALLTKTGTIGILATEASIAGEKFHHLLETHATPLKVKVITQPCPDFVTLVEAGTLEGPEVEEAVRKYAMPMVEAGADTLVLGCTHYPFLRETIQKVVGNHINIIDTGQAVAKRTLSLVPSVETESAPSLHIQTTGPLETLEALFPKLCPGTEATLSQLDL